MAVYSALWLLMPWCFSYKPSAEPMLTKILCCCMASLGHNELTNRAVMRSNGIQATGLDAWASRVKCPARFVSHLHDIYIWVVYSFCLFCCLFIIVTTQFVALYKPKPKPSTYDPPDNHPLAEIQRPILRPEPKQQICHQHANTDHFGK